MEVHGSEAAESDEEDTQPDGLESAAAAAVAGEVEAVSEHESGLEGEEASESDGEEHEEEQSEGSGSDGSLEEAADSPFSSEKQEEEEAAPGRGRKRKAHSLESDSQCSESDQDTAAAESPIRAPHADEEKYEDGQQEEGDKAEGVMKRKNAKPKLQPAADSLQTLKRQLAAAKGTGDGGAGKVGQAGVPIEWGRVLTAEDFERIKQLRHRCTTPTCHYKTQHNCLQSFVKSEGLKLCRCLYAKSSAVPCRC